MELPAIHVLHAHDHISIVMEKGSVEGYDVWRRTIMHDV